jgi:hypothetical protein
MQIILVFTTAQNGLDHCRACNPLVYGARSRRLTRIGGVPEDSAEEEMLSEKGQATHPILDCFQRFSEIKH